MKDSYGTYDGRKPEPPYADEPDLVLCPSSERLEANMNNVLKAADVSDEWSKLSWREVRLIRAWLRETPLEMPQTFELGDVVG